MDRSTLTQTPPLRTVRRSRGLSLRELARRLGMDATHLSRVERGQAGLTIERLYAIADVLGLTELRRLLEPWAVRARAGDPRATSCERRRPRRGGGPGATRRER